MVISTSLGEDAKKMGGMVVVLGGEAKGINGEGGDGETMGKYTLETVEVSIVIIWEDDGEAELENEETIVY